VQKSNGTILIVEDNRDLAENIGAFMEGHGYSVDFAGDGLTALHLAVTGRYDAIVLDVRLPGIDGFKVCERLRRDAGSGTPVLMLTALDQLDDKLEGFNAGADDYLIKPFAMRELAVRINALIRRSRGELEEHLLRVHDLTLDPKTRSVERAGKRIRLSPTTFRILRILMRESPRLVTRESLEKELWGDMIPDSDTLRSHLYNLRKAIDKPFDSHLLHTVQSVGFRLIPPDQADD